MKKHAGLIKNLIMVVASALTLVAVSFAWFTSNFKTNLDQYKVAVEGNPIKVDFYQLDENNEYKPLAGNIELNDFVPGEYNQYKLLVTTKTSDKLKMSFSIDGIPADIPQELKDNVCIKYSVHSTQKKTAADGTVTYPDKDCLAQSNGFVPLSEISEGKIFTGLSIADIQKTSSDLLVIYYEIGLSEDAPSTVSGLESSLGSVNISAQRIG